MAKKKPILLLIPHGGYLVPEELSGYESISEFDLFIQADTCANELFRFENGVSAVLDTTVSRLFVDLDRSYQDISRSRPDGVIKIKSLFGRELFGDNAFPDEIAIANILKRYYFPFHDTAEKIIATGDIHCVIECHTSMPVAPPLSPEPGLPRATVTVENKFSADSGDIITCEEEKARSLMENLAGRFSEENNSIMPGELKTAPENSYLIRKFGRTGVPYIRLSISKSLFLNDAHFSHDYLMVNEIRIREIRERIWKGIEQWSVRNL